jgi:hypothetical protein
MFSNEFNEEQLPIDRSTADIPERCLSCPGYLKRAIDIALSDGAEDTPQIISDNVREMQLCQTGPVIQHQVEHVRTEVPYSDISDRHLPRDAFLGNGTRMVKTKEGIPSTTVGYSYKKTPNLEQVCGLEADTSLLPSNAKRIRTAFVRVITEQKDNHSQHLKDVELAANPHKMMKAGRGDGLIALLMRSHPPKGGNDRILNRNVKEVNDARLRFGMPAVTATAEIYRSYGLTPPNQLQTKR